MISFTPHNRIIEVKRIAQGHRAAVETRLKLRQFQSNTNHHAILPQKTSFRSSSVSCPLVHLWNLVHVVLPGWLDYCGVTPPAPLPPVNCYTFSSLSSSSFRCVPALFPTAGSLSQPGHSSHLTVTRLFGFIFLDKLERAYIYTYHLSPFPPLNSRLAMLISNKRSIIWIRKY